VGQSTHPFWSHNIRSYESQTPNLQCFITRIASHPERLQYIYFNTVLLLRAVARIGPYLSSYDYCSSGTQQDDANTLQYLSSVIDVAKNIGKFDETTLFRGDNANVGINYHDTVSCDLRNRHDRFSKKSSRHTSATSVRSWTALDATNVASGARFRQRVWLQHSKSSSKWMRRRWSKFCPEYHFC
jgi:Endoplasmic Reticulum Oxidoreductin 1 (ERO1)